MKNNKMQKDKTYSYHVQAKTSTGESLQIIIATETPVGAELAINMGKYEIWNDLTWSVTEKSQTGLSDVKASNFIMDKPFFNKNEQK